jgi:hypothetical protein
MLRVEAVEQQIAGRSDVNEHLAAVCSAGLPPHQRLRLRAIDQPDHAVLAHLHALGELGHRRVVTLGEPLDRQQQLVLLWYLTPCDMAEWLRAWIRMAGLLGEVRAVIFATADELYTGSVERYI